ncbi:MAG TPA: hypothetical protein ENL06_01955, partial [Candidatus Portnoybacteria bacterium]|nr:hypothetical protein [Candidatus Portnoybacteria bacterium]
MELKIETQKITLNSNNKTTSIIHYSPQKIEEKYLGHLFIIQESSTSGKDSQDLSEVISSSLARYYNPKSINPEENFHRSLRATNTIIKEITEENPRAFSQTKSLILAISPNYFYLSYSHSFNVILVRQEKIINLLSTKNNYLPHLTFTEIISDKIQNNDKIFIFSPSLLIKPQTELQLNNSLPEIIKNIQSVIQ